MSERLLLEMVTSALDGKQYEISTIRTDAGGAERSSAFIFNSSMFEDINAWPFETMVFHAGSREGLYHEAHADERTARERHARIADTVRRGLELPGDTVVPPFGTPRLTPEQWRAKQAAESTSTRGSAGDRQEEQKTDAQGDPIIRRVR